MKTYRQLWSIVEVHGDFWAKYKYCNFPPDKAEMLRTVPAPELLLARHRHLKQVWEAALRV